MGLSSVLKSLKEDFDVVNLMCGGKGAGGLDLWDSVRFLRAEGLEMRGAARRVTDNKYTGRAPRGQR